VGREEYGHDVSFDEALVVWLRAAALSFCGPAAQVAVIHRILVDEKKWIRASCIPQALNYCILVSGLEAQQLAT
jgi:chromate transporter